MAEIVKIYPKTLLVISGDGPEKKNLELRQNVVIEPSVNFETLISYYKAADLFLLTSNYEGYGRTVIEAAAAGLPVVMTDVGLAPPAGGGKVTPVGDKEVLIRTILEAIKNPEIAQINLSRLGLLDKPTYLERLKQSWLNCCS
jgi:glycosyltransferase involved in cell wall biosynthesis